jgi:hypothetical protein
MPVTSAETTLNSHTVDPFEMTVHLSVDSRIDRAEVARALSVLIDPSATHELRGLPSARSRMISGSNLEDAVDSVAHLGDDRGVYFTLNPVRPDLGNRAAKVSDITLRRWLLIDVDRVKTICPDEMATPEEKSEALLLAAVTCDWLTEQGWPAPVIIDSGNGAHLLYRVDLPSTDLTRILLSKVLKALATKFNNEGAEIDTKVHNASRVSKLPGTWVRKGMDCTIRPWRMAKMIGCPEQIAVVTVEQLQAVAGETETPPPPKIYDPFEMTVTHGPDKRDAYVKSAVDSELNAVAAATPGTRNDRLNTAAFSIGQLVGAHLVDRRDAEKQLAEAGRRAGLGDTEVIKTVASGIDKGILKPRELPESVTTPSKNGLAPPKLAPGQKLTIRLKDIKPEKVDWFYENRVAPGFISIFAGRTGFGKSFATCDIVAKASRGFPPPFSSVVQPPIRTLFVSEDSPGLVIAPRLLTMGADPEMVDFLTWDALGAYTLGDTGMLERAYQECGFPRLVVIDPPSNFLGGADAHKDGEVRSILKLLVAWLDTHRVACIFIMHINKQMGKGMDAVERIVGSVAWGSTARMTLAFVKDPDVPDQYLFGGTKNNLGPLADTLAYRFSKREDGEVFIDWVGKTDTTMENAMNQVKKKSRGVCAVEWLTEQFQAQRQWESEEITRAAKEAGISRSALWSPEVNALPFKKRKRVNAAGDPCWMWIADEGWPEKKIDDTLEPVEPVGTETQF